MTQLKKLKKAVRARARKTGESYTAARRQVLLSRRKKAAPGSLTAARPAAPPTPSRPGMSDASIRKKTGHGFEHWFALLDAFSKDSKGHTAAVEHLYKVHAVPGWYCQMITVAWERARGLRAVNQSASGTFQVSVSKVVPGSVAQVAEAIRARAARRAWLRGADPEVGRALAAAFRGPQAREVIIKADRTYARLRYPWNGAGVELHVYAKPKGGASVVAYNKDLPDAAAVEERRAQWKAALEGLKTYLAR